MAVIQRLTSTCCDVAGGALKLRRSDRIGRSPERPTVRRTLIYEGRGLIASSLMIQSAMAAAILSAPASEGWIGSMKSSAR